MCIYVCTITKFKIEHEKIKTLKIIYLLIFLYNFVVVVVVVNAKKKTDVLVNTSS